MEYSIVAFNQKGGSGERGGTVRRGGGGYLLLKEGQQKRTDGAIAGVFMRKTPGKKRIPLCPHGVYIRRLVEMKRRPKASLLPSPLSYVYLGRRKDKVYEAK